MKKIKHLAPQRKVIPLQMDATFFFERAVQSLDRYRYDKALKYFRKAVEYEPDNPVNHCNMAGILSEMGNYAESNQVLQQIVDQIDPTMTECYFYMANNFANMEDFAAAEQALIQYLEHDSSGQFIDESEEMMELLCYELERPAKITKIKSREGFFEHDKARVLLEEGQFLEAIKLLENTVKMYPNFLAAHNNLALAYYYVGRSADAFSAVDRVLEQDPGNLHGLCNLAIFYQHSGDRNGESSNELIRLLEKTVPYHEEHVFKLATTLGVLGYHETALSHFRRLLKSVMSQDDPCLYHYAAVASYNTGRFSDARKYWKQVEKMDPSSDIPNFYLSVLDRMKDEPGALSLSYHYHLPFEDHFRQLQRLQFAGPLPERFRNDPLLRSSFFWAIRHGSRDAKLQMIQIYCIEGDREVADALRELLLNPNEDDYVKKVAVFALRHMGVKEAVKALIGGREVVYEEHEYAQHMPEWAQPWQDVIDLALVRMSPRYDMIQQYDMVTLWVEFLSRQYPATPKLLKKEGWAGALEYLTAKMHRRAITYHEIAGRYGVSITTVSKHAKMIDEVCGLREKMNSIFANLKG